MWNELLASIVGAIGSPSTSFMEDPTYDYENARKFGLQPNPEDNHWPSRMPHGPEEGLILKSENHPTFNKTLQGEADAGYMMFRNPFNKRLYSFPKGVDVPGYLVPYY